jgi:transglutaminase-like putative cysteine protease
MRYKLRHATTYAYAETATLSHNAAHLRPLNDGRQILEDFRLDVTPSPRVFTETIDTFGNRFHLFQLQEPHREFSVVAESEVEVLDPGFPEPSSTVPWDDPTTRPGHQPSGNLALISEHRHASPFVPLLEGTAELARRVFEPGRPILEAGAALTALVKSEFKYSPRSTTLATPVTEILALRRGVCQDFAHLMLSAFRSLGLIARYVSGYLETLPPPGKQRLVGADASHAWVQLWVPDSGWVDLDPTNGCIVGERHIRVAVGRDYGDVTPLKGLILGGGAQTISVSVDVAPVA